MSDQNLLESVASARLLQRMFQVRYLLAVCTVIVGLLLVGATGAWPQETEKTAARLSGPVTGERIKEADSEPGAWLSHGRTYGEQRYSPLTQINEDNVAKLGLAWSYDTGKDRGHEATPLLANGVLYLTTSWSTVHAIDARTGEGKWIYDPDVPKEWGAKACCDVVNRGVALWGEHVFVGTLDGRLVKLDADSGKVVWEKNTIDRSQHYTITGAPRVVKGKVIIGNGGAEYGVRGYVSAYDADSGDLVWRFFTVPGDPSKGFEHEELEMAAETWTGEWWHAGGGGTVWDSMAFDPELDLLYVGTGNGSPWARKHRSPGGGDNLFLSSILALDPDDGRLVWHYQTTPADNWDYTATQHILLADLEIAGKKRQVLMQAPKNGFFYVIDRKTGELLSADPFTDVTWATHVDMATGRPVENPATNYDQAPKQVLPGPDAAHNWHPMSYNPDTGLVYIPVREWPTIYNLVDEYEYDPNVVWNLGITWADDDLIPMYENFPAPRGVLLAWDPVARKEAWSVRQVTANNGGLLTTAGNLLFQGLPDGRFVAYSATEGELLWFTSTGIGIVAAPITWQLDGKQYVTVLAGWGGAVSGVDLEHSAAVKNTNPGRVFTFELNGKKEIPAVERRYAKLDPPPAVDASEEELRRGRLVLVEHCGRCHGYELGSSGLNSDLRYASKAVHDNWNAIVLDGRFLARGMPPFRSILTEQQASDVHAYVRFMAQTRPEL